MRFYDFEDWLGDLLDRVPWRWVLGPLLAYGVECAVLRWLVWHGWL